MRISDWSSDVCSSDLKVRCQLESGGPRDDRRAAGVDAGVGRHCRVAQFDGRGGVQGHERARVQRYFGDARLSIADLLRERQRSAVAAITAHVRSEEHTSELQSLMRISYAVFCLKNKKKIQ